MPLKDFQIISKLGDGAYSTVYKVTRKQDNRTYALKRVKMGSLSAKQKQNALNQIRILASINHQNIISYKQAFVDEASKSLCIVMQFANNRDLAYHIQQKQKNETLFSQQQIWNIFIQTVRGLSLLHEQSIFHRDLKSANVFMHLNDAENQLSVKLGDMNVSKISQRGMCMTQTGTPYYASPEVWKDKPYDSKSDIWSLGCVLYEMITLQPPFKAEDMQGLYKKVTRGIYPRIPSQYSQDLSSMVRCLLQVNPQMRPSCEKILKMSSVIKKMKSNAPPDREKIELLRTIRAGESFTELNDNLPKANYALGKQVRKQKGIKSLIQTLQQKIGGLTEADSLPMLQKQRKVRPAENSDRVLIKQKRSINVIERDRKKSQVIIDRVERRSSKGNLQINTLNQKQNQNQNQNQKSVNNPNQLKQLKLPKVQNRYNKIKQKIYKQNSLRTHKIYQ